jgi:hypothetical protein
MLGYAGSCQKFFQHYPWGKSARQRIVRRRTIIQIQRGKMGGVTARASNETNDRRRIIFFFRA